MPLWMFLALLVPIILGVINVIDKLVVERYVATIFYYAFWVGLLEFSIGSLLLLGLSFDGSDSRAIWGGILAGLVRAGGFFALLAALSRGQLARVAPIYYLYPLMVAPMGAVFLGEELGAVLWAAIFLAVVGAGLVSWEGGSRPGVFSRPTVLAFAITAALLNAMAFVLSKYFVEREPFWSFYAASRAGFGLGMLTTLLMDDVRRTGLGMIANRSFIALTVLASVLVTGAIAASLGALSMGPVSLVTALGALLPSVVLFYSLALARLAPGGFENWVTVRSLPTQAVGIAAITSGVVLIALR